MEDNEKRDEEKLRLMDYLEECNTLTIDSDTNMKMLMSIVAEEATEKTNTEVLKIETAEIKEDSEKTSCQPSSLHVHIEIDLKESVFTNSDIRNACLWSIRNTTKGCGEYFKKYPHIKIFIKIYREIYQDTSALET